MHHGNALETALFLAHAIKRQLAQQLESEEFGLAPMHVRVMKIIHKRSTCTALDIASHVKRDKAQITRLIKGLIDQGLIQKKPNPEDKRSQLLVLTDDGRVVQESLLKLAEETQEIILQDIDEEALNTFVNVAQKMTKNLNNSEICKP